MKSHLTRVCLALLSTAFLLSCQDVGSGPVGPDGLVPQFHAAHAGTCKGHDKCDDPPEPPPPSDDGTFTAAFTMNVNGGAGLVDGKGALSGPHSGKQNLGGGGVNQLPIPLTFVLNLNNSDIFLHTVEGGESCFPVNGSGTASFEGIMDIHKKTPNSNEARISYWFTAKDKQFGTTDVTYSLSLSGILDPAKWPPALNTFTTIDGSSGTFMVGSNNSPASLACKGTGSVNFSVVVTRIT